MKLDQSISGLDGLVNGVANTRRRALLRYLREQPEKTATLDDLCRHLETGESTGLDEMPVGAELEIELYHTHMPKLAEQNLVDYDPGTGRVEYRPDEMVEALLDIIESA